MQDKYFSINVTASKQIRATPGTIVGIIVNSHTNGTLKLWNNTTAAIPATGEPYVCDTFSFPAGSGVYMFSDPVFFSNALFATIGGTANIQLLVQ